MLARRAEDRDPFAITRPWITSYYRTLSGKGNWLLAASGMIPVLGTGSSRREHPDVFRLPDYPKTSAGQE